MDFSKIKREFLKEVWVGPKSQVSPFDVERMLSKYGYYDRNEELDIYTNTDSCVE